jgi:hypothetical protein
MSSSLSNNLPDAVLRDGSEGNKAESFHIVVDSM